MTKLNPADKKIILSGYYGFGNAGDEAMLWAIVKQLRLLEPDVKIVVLSNNPAETRATFGVEAVNRWYVPDIIKVMQGASLLISGGGSLLQDVTSPKSILYYLGVVRIAQAMGLATIFYSQGIGPIRGTWGKRLIPKVANNVDILSVRDRDSAALLKRLGVTKEIMITADPVMVVEKSQVDLSFGQQVLGNTSSRGRIGLVLRDWKNIEQLLPPLAEWCGQCIEQGWQIALVPFHLPQDWQVGKQLIEKIGQQGNLYGEKCVLLDRSYNTEEYLSIIGNLDFMISMRLHGLIMAAVMEVPLTGISYDPKVEAFLEQVDQPLCSNMTQGLTGPGIIENLSMAFQQRDELKERLQESLPQLRQRAKDTAKIAVELCK